MISSLFPKRGNRNAQRTENKNKNKITPGKTLNKSPRRIKATKWGFKALLWPANFNLGPDAILNTEIYNLKPCIVIVLDIIYKHAL